MKVCSVQGIPSEAKQTGAASGIEKPTGEAPLLSEIAWSSVYGLAAERDLIAHMLHFGFEPIYVLQ